MATTYFDPALSAPIAENRSKKLTIVQGALVLGIPFTPASRGEERTKASNAVMIKISPIGLMPRRLISNQAGTPFRSETRTVEFSKQFSHY
ncbi:MAG: hypothetical protein KDA80_20220 [Planctomycetaceae bacterium]|nr:hypothetical protein [Planctomycetaceae bacterium]